MAMDTKQKTLLVVTVIAFGFLGYQLYKLVSHDQDTVKTVLPMEHARVKPMDPPLHLVTMPMKVEKPLQKPAKRAPLVVKKVSPATAAAIHNSWQADVLHLQTPEQKKYAKLLNQLQIAHLRHQLLLQEAAIAAARHRISVENKKTQALGGRVFSDAVGVSDDPGYRLSYVGMKDHIWTATLARGNHYINVAVGSRLSSGQAVSAISHQGVTLQNAKMRELVTFNGVVILPKPEPKPAAIIQTKKVKKSVRVIPINIKTLSKPSLPNIKTATTSQNKPVPLKKNTTHKQIKAKVQSKKIKYSFDEKRLLAISPDYYTLQLLGSYHPFVIKDFILANHLKNSHKDFQYYVYNGSRQRWHMLLYGVYHNLYFAKQALKKLPASMRPPGVIIRQLADVQRDIRGRAYIAS